MIRFDGNSDESVKLWHTYVFWAKQQALLCPGAAASVRPAIADDPNNRVDVELSEALRTIVFASFLLEYRLRRVFSAFGLRVRPRITLKPLLDSFWEGLKAIPRIHGGGFCEPSAEWKNCEPALKQLVHLRNAIAHADYEEILAIFSQYPKLAVVALEHYNAVVDAIRLINAGTGYDIRTPQELEQYFEPLKVQVQLQTIGGV